jgi:hypothetical protein
MKTITITIYKFEELSDKAKQNAIENLRQSYYEYNDFASWAVDDCSLFEPIESELKAIGFDSNKGFLIENTRESIYFDTGRSSYLDCSKAMNITNSNLFLKWLGIDTSLEGLTDIDVTIFTSNYRNSSTTIDFGDYSSDFDELIETATKKFNDHIESVLERIESDIDYRYTDEAITEELIDNDYDFTDCGNIY